MEERFETFTFLISGIAKYIRKIKTEEMESFSLKSPHVNCLFHLYKEKTLTAKELCDIIGEDKANVSRSLEYLERNGFIQVDSKTVKRYKSPLRLTDKGQAAGKEIAFKIENFVSLISNRISEEDRKIMYKCLAIINNNLKKACEGGSERSTEWENE